MISANGYLYSEDKNHQRMITDVIDADTTAVRLISKTTYFSESLWTTYGSAQVHIFAFDLN